MGFCRLLRKCWKGLPVLFSIILIFIAQRTVKEFDSWAKFPGLEASSASLSLFEWNLYPIAAGCATQGRNARLVRKVYAVWDQSFPSFLPVYADQGWQPPGFNLGSRSKTELSFGALVSILKVVWGKLQVSYTESHRSHASHLQVAQYLITLMGDFATISAVVHKEEQKATGLLQPGLTSSDRKRL